MKVGLTLPSRGVMFGATTGKQLLRMARIADECGQFVGDSLLAKPCVESIVLLSAVVESTKRVRLGTACMASFPLREPVLLRVCHVRHKNTSQ